MFRASDGIVVVRRVDARDVERADDEEASTSTQARAGEGWIRCRATHVFIALFIALTCVVGHQLSALTRGAVANIIVIQTRAALEGMGLNTTSARRGSVDDNQDGGGDDAGVEDKDDDDDDDARRVISTTTASSQEYVRGSDVKANDPAVDVATLCSYIGVDVGTFERDRGAAFVPASAFVDGVNHGRDAVRKKLDAVFGEVKSSNVAEDARVGVIHAHAMPGDVVADVARYAADVVEQFNVWGVRDVDVVLTGVEESAREMLELTALSPRRVAYESETTAMKMVREAFASAQLTTHTGTFLAGISRLDAMFITPDYTTPSRVDDGAVNVATSNDSASRETMSAALASAARWRMWNPYVGTEDFIVSLGAASVKANECDELWGWGSLRDRYVLTSARPAIDGGATVVFTSSRSQRHATAKGTVTMEATWMHVPVNRVAIDVSRVPDSMSGNPWHRLTAIYAAFLTRKKFFPNRKDVDVLVPCATNKPLSVPAGWERIGTPTCERDRHSVRYDVIASPPKDGHLWDLAWDYDLPCKGEDLFKVFVELMTPNAFSPPTVPFKERPACWLARQSGRIRSVGNEEDVITAMKAASGAAGFQYLEITSETTLMETITAIQHCGVLVGLHGAGMINQIYALVDTTVIEIAPPAVAYYKNVAQLRDQKYVPVFYKGSTSEQNIMVPMESFKTVLRDVYAARRRRA